MTAREEKADRQHPRFIAREQDRQRRTADGPMLPP